MCDNVTTRTDRHQWLKTIAVSEIKLWWWILKMRSHYASDPCISTRGSSEVRGPRSLNAPAHIPHSNKSGNRLAIAVLSTYAVSNLPLILSVPVSPAAIHLHHPLRPYSNRN